MLITNWLLMNVPRLHTREKSGSAVSGAENAGYLYAQDKTRHTLLTMYKINPTQIRIKCKTRNYEKY